MGREMKSYHALVQVECILLQKKTFCAQLTLEADFSLKSNDTYKYLIFFLSEINGSSYTKYLTFYQTTK